MDDDWGYCHLRKPSFSLTFHLCPSTFHAVHVRDSTPLVWSLEGFRRIHGVARRISRCSRGAENATPARLCRWENHQLITKLLADQHEIMLNSTIQKHIKSHENWAFHKWGSPKVDGFKHDAKLCRYAQSQPNSGLAYTEFRKEASGTALSDGGPFPSLVEFPKVPPKKIANTWPYPRDIAIQNILKYENWSTFHNIPTFQERSR